MLGKRKIPGQRPRTVIVKFQRRNDRQSVFRNKNLLKGIGISVTKSFIQKGMENLKRTSEHGFAHVEILDWITFKENDGNPKVYCSWVVLTKLITTGKKITVVFIFYFYWGFITGEFFGCFLNISFWSLVITHHFGVETLILITLKIA